MDKPIYYEIRIEGHLTGQWADWFDGLTIRDGREGETILQGSLPDQAALLGVLARLQALNLTVISVNKQGAGSTSAGALDD